MAHILLTGHADFAKGLASALSMVAGDIEAFSIVTFNQDEAATFPQTISDTIKDGLSKQGSVLVFCDLKGGTPFNCSMVEAANNNQVEVIGGVNLPILIETVFTHQVDFNMPAKDLAAIAMNAAATSIAHENQGTFNAANAIKTEDSAATAANANNQADALEDDEEGI